MKTRRRTFRGKTRSKGRAPWRETRLVESMLSGGLCRPGLSEVCDEEILGLHFVFPNVSAPCATILAYPVLWTPDWQSVDSFVSPAWKERVVHTHSTVDVTIQPSPYWMAEISRSYQTEIQTQVPEAVLIAPWKSAMFVYDDDEVIATPGLTSMFVDGWMETERYIPGTLRSGTLYHQGSVVENLAQKVKVSTSAKRRLETGEGIYWVFEMGCVTAQDASGDRAGQLGAQYGGPFWLLGQIHSSYTE